MGILIGVDMRAKAKEAAALQNDIVYFTKVMFKSLNGRDFIITRPPSRRSHILEILELINDIVHGKCPLSNVNIAPGHFKSTLFCYGLSWAYSMYPKSHSIYASYSGDLATGQTGVIRSIMSLPVYNDLFGVRISPTTRARGDFWTVDGGRIYAAGFGGTITGINAGLAGGKEFNGMLIIDDAHKMSEVHYPVSRAKAKHDFHFTLEERRRGRSEQFFITPLAHIGQRGHGDDLPSEFIGNPLYRNLILPSLDGALNPLAPEIISKEALLIMRDEEPYKFAAQHQQDPTPDGGALFKEEDFELLDQEPEMLVTFITADCAETDKTYNDATAFSFCGIYKIRVGNGEATEYGLHIINAWELRIEPCDLEPSLLDFYSQCCLYPKKPSFVAIEKKSTGTTLVSTVRKMRGIDVMPIERTVKSGSKAQRFINCQKYIRKRLISLPRFARHTSLVIDHMSKISPSMTQAHDDIADTIADAIDMTYISGIALNFINESTVTALDDYLSERSSAYSNINYVSNDYGVTGF